MSHPGLERKKYMRLGKLHSSAGLAVLVLVVALGVGCTSTPSTPADPDAPSLAKLSEGEIKEQLSRLMTTHGFAEADKDQLLTKRLPSVLEDPTVKSRMADPGVTAVGVYKAAGGGFLVEGGGGDGLVYFRDAAGDRPISLKGFKTGAVIGGGNRQGFFLVFGLIKEDSLAGTYNFSSAGAQAGKGAAVFTGTASSTSGSHEIRFHAVGTGMSASAGGGRFSITYTD
jgi:hypothetical protein